MDALRSQRGLRAARVSEALVSGLVRACAAVRLPAVVSAVLAALCGRSPRLADDGPLSGSGWLLGTAWACRSSPGVALSSWSRLRPRHRQCLWASVRSAESNWWSDVPGQGRRPSTGRSDTVICCCCSDRRLRRELGAPGAARTVATCCRRVAGTGRLAGPARTPRRPGPRPCRSRSSIFSLRLPVFEVDQSACLRPAAAKVVSAPASRATGQASASRR